MRFESDAARPGPDRQPRSGPVHVAAWALLTLLVHALGLLARALTGTLFLAAGSVLALLP